MSNLTKGIFPHFILAVLILALYGNTLTNGFVHDDVWQVKDRPFADVFKSCIAEEIVGGCERGFYWRPMQYVSYYITFRFSSEPWVFHLVNLVYFWAAGVLVYLIAAQLVGSGLWVVGGKKDQATNYKLQAKRSERTTNYLPLFAAIIFIAHPVNSEVVNWVSATPELLMTIFGLLSLIFFVRANTSHGSNKQSLRSSSLRTAGLTTYWSYLLSLVFFFLALLSKETAAVVLPLALISADLLLMSADKAYRHPGVATPTIGSRIKILSLHFEKSQCKRSRMTSILFFLIPLGLYLLLRTEVLGRVVYKYEGYYVLSAQDQIFTALALFPKYLLELIWPLPLSFQELIMPTRTFDLEVSLGLGILGLFGLAILFFAHPRGVLSRGPAHAGGDAVKLIAFGLVLVLLGILPPLLFVNKLGQFIFSERYLFFSTMGLAIVVVEAATILIRTNEKRIYSAMRFSSSETRLWAYGTNYKIWLMLSALVLYVVGSWFVVVNRNRDWKDNLASYQAMIRVDPRNSNAHFQLGRYYQGQQQLDVAAAEFKAAIEIDPSNEEAKSDLTFLENVYSFDGLYSFNFPMGWNVSKNGGRVIVSKANVKVEITEDIKKSNQIYDQYIADQKAVGEVVNQGLAQIPGTDFAYVRIYKNNFEFYLFKRENVVRVYLIGANSQADINDFNRILGSIRIEPR